MIKRVKKETFADRLTNIFRHYWLQITIMIGLILAVSLFFPRGKSLQFTYQLNDIAREPVIAPFTFPILKTDEKLQADLNEALLSEPFVFNRDQQIVEIWSNQIKEFFLLAMEIHHAKNQLNQSKDLVYRYRYEPQYDVAQAEFSADSTALALLLETFQKDYPFPIDQDPWKTFLKVPENLGPKYDLTQFEEDIIQICRNRWAEGIYDIAEKDIISHEVMVNHGDVPSLADPDDYNDLEVAWIKAKVEITNLYPDENDPRRKLGYDLIVEFMKPNLIYDKETTERRQQERLDRVPRFQGTILKDERIVDANTRINEDILQKLQSLTVEVAKQEGAESGWRTFLAYLGRLILIGVVVSFSFTFLLIYRTPIFNDWKMILLISLIFAVELGLSHLFVLRLNVSPYLIPITVAAMTLTILFDARIGFMGTTSMAILTGIMIGNNLDFIVVGIFMSGVAAYNVRDLRTRAQVFSTIFSLIGASIIVVIGLGLFKNSSWASMRMDLLYLLIISILAPIITYGLIGVLEVAFKVTTDLTLLELLDFDHPLLKRLQQEANGTFNHSIVVGNLAEACANAIGARSLLCRVGAYYHDVGKMTRPEYFIENQFSGENKHDSLTSTMSARTIRNHVKEGLQLAEEYGLPKIVSDFIPMHHGTTRVEYFYRKALAEAEDSSEVDENAFRYPGPKPNTKETGILMICEAVEAAVRSIKNPDVFKIEEMIAKIIRKRIEEGQLNECPLTLDELRRIVGTVNGTTGMLPVLRGIYHIRIEYPEEKKPKPDPDLPPPV